MRHVMDFYEQVAILPEGILVQREAQDRQHMRDIRRLKYVFAID